MSYYPPRMVLSSDVQAVEACGSYWLSVASAVAIPTLAGIVSIFYVRVRAVRGTGGREIVVDSLVAEIMHFNIGSYANARTARIDEKSCGCHGFTVVSWYPILNFYWPTTATTALESGLQLTRIALDNSDRPVLEHEYVGSVRMLLAFCSFAFATVGALRKPDEVPAALRAFFTAGAVPDIRVFLLASTMSSVFGSVMGIIGGLTSDAPSAREAARGIRMFTTWFWSAICLGCFALGCWQINERRKMHLSTPGMFIYWAPASVIITLTTICGIRVFGVLGIVGVVLGIVAGNSLSCGQSG